MFRQTLWIMREGGRGAVGGGEGHIHAVGLLEHAVQNGAQILFDAGGGDAELPREANLRGRFHLGQSLHDAGLPGPETDFGEADWLAWAQRTCRETAQGIAFAYDPAIAQGFSEDESQPQPDMWPLWEMLGQTPVLAIRGELSDLLDRDTLAAMQARHRGPFASVEVPRRGHAPLLDEPAALTAITAFLKDHAQ